MNSDAEVGMIDISKLIRDTFTQKELEHHIFDDDGGSSVDMLKRILERGSMITAVGPTPQLLCDYIKGYGPGLVSCFEVYDDFNRGDIHSHVGAPVGEFKGLHAMVMIGYRVAVDTGKTFFLLQNWWKTKQFVEVDEEYLKRCGAVMYFVETPQTKIPSEFPINMGKFLENENDLDKPESYRVERLNKH
jgi:hypothetical protein